MATNEKRFSFISLGLPGDTFGVVRFNGTEGLSKIYEFEIQLVSSDPELDLNEVIQNPARLTLFRDEGKDAVFFNGILSEFDQLHQVGEMCFYRALLVPKVWWLSQTIYNQVFLDMSIPEIIEQVLRSGGLTDDDFEIDLDFEVYQKQEYLCQYRETHLDFISRLMEGEGIYYYFEQTSSREKIIITDNKSIHKPMAEGEDIFYSPPSGLDERSREEVVKSFSCRQKVVSQKVYLRDHNWERPYMDVAGGAQVIGLPMSMNVEGSAEVFEEGRGEVYFFGDHFTTAEEGDRLAEIRAEEFLCRKQSFFGDSTVPFLRPGYTFALRNHFRDSFNQSYLIVDVSHEGSQASFMLAGLPGEPLDQEKHPMYRNSVTALPDAVQFRPQRVTRKPRFHGSLTARIDAAGNGEYAELDKHGRYKVILPFDRSERASGEIVDRDKKDPFTLKSYHFKEHQGGKASAWIRMMQPYSGTDHGMHFPLHKGAEVLLTFIDGDPDRPVIAGAVSNPESPSVVTEENQTQCNIITSGGNKITFEDKKDHEQVMLQCPHEDTLIKLGSPSEDVGWYKRMGFGGVGLVSAAISYKKTALKAGLALGGVIFAGHSPGVEDGIEMRTKDGLKIAARKKEEAIGGYLNPGHSETEVVGISARSYTGYAEKSVTGWSEETVVGAHNFQVYGNSTTTITGWAQLLETAKTKLQGKVETVVGTAQTVAGKVTNFFGSKTKMSGKEEELINIEMSVIASEKTVSGTQSELTGDSQKMSGSNSEVVANDSKMSGNSTSVGASTSQISTKSTTVNADNTSISTNSTSLDVKKTGLSTVTVNVAGSHHTM